MSYVKDDAESWMAVMSRIIENLGPNVEEARYELCESDVYFMSSRRYVCVKFKNKTNGRSEQLSMIVKRPILHQRFRDIFAIDQQFNNEIVFYEMYAQPDDNFPRCIYAKNLRSIDSLIALENVSERGYRNCPYNYDPPLGYTLAAMRELGRFHGKGYVMKERQPEKFFDIVGRLEEVRYVKKFAGGMMNTFISFANNVGLRAVKQLRNRGHDTDFCDKVEALLSNAFERVMLKITQVPPSEPLSTLCHGDFVLTNMLFKTECDGQYRAMLLDFGLLMYGTPVIDLSTYICLHCSYETRRDKFFDIFKAYHEALKEYLYEAGIRNIERYSYELLLDDYRRGGFFGFIIASLYLSAIKNYEFPTLELVLHEKHKFLNEVCTAGGDEISEELANMLLEMKDLGYLKYVL